MLGYYFRYTMDEALKKKTNYNSKAQFQNFYGLRKF